MNEERSATMNTILRVNDLVTTFRYGKKDIPVVNGVSFEVHEGEILGIVGESGCGKSVTSLSIMRLINPPGKIAQGEILLGDTDLTKVPANKLHRLRGKDIAMIFQEPMTSLNPLQTIGRQIAEAVLLHSDVTKQQAWEKAVEMLGMVGIASPEKRAKAYPHMLSGGMRQRVMIAMALSMNPHLLIADEPTTALDVTVQAQILELIKKLRDEIGMAIMLITHDLGVISETCERVIVMYAGEIVEQAPIRELFSHPSHPYTQGLIASVPRMKQTEKLLHTIPGMVPGVQDMPEGCRFAPRCSRAQERCMKKKPPTFAVNDGHYAACWLCAGRE
ncbi:MAG: ABC transporter ATP-binding protein [Christensenellaceae bacterium]|nr:ABC transporter ATP-binding protein [Christensenellaceae bacterium]